MFIPFSSFYRLFYILNNISNLKLYKNSKIINLFPIYNILFVDFYWYDKTRIIMSGLIDKDDAMQSYKKKKYFTRTKAFIFPYFYWSFYRTYVTIFALTIITLSQIGLINYDLVKNCIFISNNPLPFIKLNALFLH